MALNLTRTVGQSFWVNYEIKVTVSDIRGKWARLRVECNEKYDISRTERLRNRLGLLGCAHSKTMCPGCMNSVIGEIERDDERVKSKTEIEVEVERDPREIQKFGIKT